MIIRNLLVGLPAILACMVLQVALAFWGVRYFIRRTSSATIERGSLFGLRPLLVVMLVMMLGTVVQIALWGVLFVALGEPLGVERLEQVVGDAGALAGEDLVA